MIERISLVNFAEEIYNYVINNLYCRMENGTYEIDFCIDDPGAEPHGWCGIKSLPVEMFDSSVILYGNYYGGGCASIVEIRPDEDKDIVIYDIIKFLTNVVDDNSNSILCIERKEDQNDKQA